MDTSTPAPSNSAKAKIAALVAVGAVLLLTAGLVRFSGSWRCQDGTWTAIGRPLLRPPTTACAKPEPIAVPPKRLCSPPWSCGRLAQGETGMKRDTWYLKYEDETGPARLEIDFLDNAVCHVDGVQADCDRLFPPNGTASSFSGYRDGDIFRVSALDFTIKP